VNEKRDILYFNTIKSHYWLLRPIALMDSHRRCAEDDQISRLQYMAQLQGCHSLAFNLDIVPRVTPRGILNWIRTFVDMKTMVVVVHASMEILPDGSRFVVSSDEKAVREVRGGYASQSLKDINTITQLYRAGDLDVRVPKLERGGMGEGPSGAFYLMQASVAIY
jgi:hypothetical protein